MGLEENKAVVRRNFELVSGGDAVGAAALYSPISSNHGRQVTREEIRAVFGSLVELGEKFTIHEMVAEGDWVACRAIVSGRHKSRPGTPVGGGIYSMAEPRGETYTLQHMHLFRIVDGQIVEHWANRDDLGAARQLGLELKPVERDRSN